MTSTIERTTAVKMRLFPSEEQAKFLEQCGGCARAYWNALLYHYKETNYKDESTGEWHKGELLNAKNFYSDPNFPWRKEVSSRVYGYVLMTFKESLNNYKGNPYKLNFKPKYEYAISFTSDRAKTQNWVDKSGRLCINKIKSTIKTDGHLDLVGRPYKYTFSRTSNGDWYVSIACDISDSETPVNTKKDEEKSVLGIDMSMGEFAVFSTGEHISDRESYKDFKSEYERLERRRVHYQRIQSRRVGSKKGEEKSKGLLEAKKHVADIMQRQKDLKKNFFRKLAYEIAQNYDVVVVEDLDIKAMGKHKSGGKFSFGKTIGFNAYSEFTTFLKYEMEKNGKEYMEAYKYFPSSQLCSHINEDGTKCNYKNVDTKNLSVREWTCPVCGTHHDRDVNASKNLKYYWFEQKGILSTVFKKK